MNPRVAFIDIGTNTILCLIVELRSGGRFRVLTDLAEIARLGYRVDETGEIGPQGEQRAFETLGRYVKRCRRLGVREFVAVGTSALRDARNSGDVRERFKERLGLDVRVLSGPEEATYAFLAVRRGLGLGPGERLVVDVGGGSTEFIRGSEAGISGTASLDLGSVRLTERYLHSDPVTEQEFARATEAIDAEIAPLTAGILRPAPDLSLIGIAGTFTTLAAVELGLARYSHRDVQGHRVALREIRRQIDLYRRKSVAERKAISGLEPARADIILAGALLIERVMNRAGVETVTVSDQGVRYGLLYERLDRDFAVDISG